MAKSALAAILFVLLPSLTLGNPLPTSEWLVYLARDHAVGLAGKQTERDVEHVRALLEASIALDQNQQLAHRWLYELKTLEGDREAAMVHLKKLAELQPEDETIWYQLIQSGATSRELGARAQWLQQQLGVARTPSQRALVHLELAEVAYQRFDLDLARKHFTAAHELAPSLPGLARFEVQLLEPDADPGTRLRVLLRSLRANPVQVEAPWRIAVLLDEHNLPELAGTFYDHAVSVHDTTDPDGDVPPEYLRQLSRNAIARGDRSQALDYATRAARADRASYSSSFYLLWLFNATEQLGQARILQKQLEERFAEVKEPDNWPVQMLASIAWFHCTADPQAERALMLAEAAAKGAPGDPFVERVLGLAQALSGDDEAAIATLAPLKDDPHAAVKLAELLSNAGRGDEAKKILAAQRHFPVAGYARDELARIGMLDALPQGGESIKQAIQTFDGGLLLFHQAPWRFIKAEVRPIDLSPGVAEPWWVELALTNRATFPITLGPEEMVNPVFLLSFELEGDKTREYPGLLTISVEAKRVLQPGETVSVRRALDLGPLRSVTARTPQQLQRVAVTGWLDPLQQGGTWRASATGQELTRTTFNRRPVLTTREAWNAIFSGMESTTATTVYRSIEALAGLLAESQYARLGRLEYKPAPIPVAKVRETLLGALRSPIWQVRVRTLAALRWTGLDQEMLTEIESSLEHEHWLVRLMAVRLLGQRQGDGFAERAKQMAAGDANALVQTMAGCYAAE